MLAIFNGLGWSFITIGTNVIWAHYFGRENLGKITAPQFATNIIASGLGPYPFSLAYELLGSYSYALYLFASIEFTLAVALVTIQEPILKEGGQ